MKGLSSTAGNINVMPYFGLYLKDLTFIEGRKARDVALLHATFPKPISFRNWLRKSRMQKRDIVVTHVDGNNNFVGAGIVNFQKMRMVASIITEIQRAQQSKFPFKKNLQILAYLNYGLILYDEDTVYNKSKQCERGSDPKPLSSGGNENTSRLIWCSKVVIQSGLEEFSFDSSYPDGRSDKESNFWKESSNYEEQEFWHEINCTVDVSFLPLYLHPNVLLSFPIRLWIIRGYHFFQLLRDRVVRKDQGQIVHKVPPGVQHFRSHYLRVLCILLFFVLLCMHGFHGKLHRAEEIVLAYFSSEPRSIQ